LVEIVGGLFEVVTDDLVQLDEGPLLPEPAGETAMEVCTNGLRERFVGGVTDQQMAEAEGVVAGELGPVRPDQLVPDECGQPRQHLGLLRSERLDGAAMEDLALDRSPLEHGTLLRLQLVEPCSQEGP